MYDKEKMVYNTSNCIGMEVAYLPGNGRVEDGRWSCERYEVEGV